MIRLLDNTTTTKFNYFYLFCIVIFAGNATAFARSLGNPIALGNAIALLLSFLFCYKNKIVIKKNFIYTIIAYSIYAVLTFINNNLMSPMWYCQIVTFLFIAYIICQGYKKSFFVLYETIIYHLSIIAIIFWSVYLIAPGVIETVVSIFQFDKSYSEEAIDSKNMIIYTLLSEDRQTNNYINLLRNAGFAWEPGAFSCILCLAIYCNMLRTNCKIKQNKHLLILILTLATTFSTTGYMIFLCMIFFVWFILKKKYAVGIILIPTIVMIFQLQFVQEKMFNEFTNVDNVNIDLFDEEKTVSLGRIASLKYDFMEFLRHPILGLGGYTEGTWLAKMGYNIATISGIGKLLSMYGIIITIIFFVLLFKSAKIIGKNFNTNISWLLPVVIIGTMISYNLWLNPIYIIFWMYCLLGYKDFDKLKIQF